MKKSYTEAYKEFMYNKDNIRNCEACPENEGFDDWQGRLPCGQHWCWVTQHCMEEGDD